MTKTLELKYRYEILLLFALLEVILFDTNEYLKFFVAIIEYLLITYILLKNKEVGIMYFISFTTLALGQENYVVIENIPPSFWGIRIGGFSLNIIFSIAIVVYLLLRNKYNYLKIRHEINVSFFIYFILYSTIIGLIALAYSANYSDNFIKDTLTYYPFFIYLYLISFLRKELVLKIIEYCIPVSIFMMIVSLLTKKMFQYSIGDYYVLQNSYSFILPIAIFCLKDLYTKWLYIVLILTVGYIYISGNAFIGGKQIIMIFISFLWLGMNYRRYILPILLSLVTFLIFIEPAFSFMIEYFSDKGTSFKFAQIYQVLNLDIKSLASQKSSMANIAGEGMTLLNYLDSNKLILLFGKGFGSGIPDTLGYLSSWAGNSGYSYHDLTRNDFHKLHLPIYEILLKSGLFGLGFYLYILSKGFFIKNKYSFLYVIILLSTFYVSKEYMLLTVILIYAMKDHKHVLL